MKRFMSLAVAGTVAGVSGCRGELIEGRDIVVLRQVTVMDGTGGPPIPDAVVVIDGDRIVRVGRATEFRFGADARVEDLPGRWVVPGFVDMHAHMPGVADQPRFLAALLASGITTARSTAADPETGVLLRGRLARGEVLGPRLLTAGTLIDGPDSFWDFAAKVRNSDEVRAEVRRQAAEKVDFIKLYVGLRPELVRVAIDESHRHGLKVVGHLGRTTWLEAIDAGIDALTHSWIAGLGHSIVPADRREEFRNFFIPNTRFDPNRFAAFRSVVDLDGPEMRRLVVALARRRVVVDPNLVLGEAVIFGNDTAVLARLEPAYALPHQRGSWSVPHPYSANWTPDQYREAQETFPTFLAAIRIMHEGGVLITAGTDLLNPWMTAGVSFHRELALLARAGIPSAEVIRIATRNGAEGLGLLAETGTVEAGKLADLVVLGADPLEEIGNTRRIERVFLRGRELDLKELRMQAGWR